MMVKTVKTQFDVVIVGGGPAGIFAALELVKHPQMKIAILERGYNLSKRSCPANEQGIACANCSSCSITCGWGGAGAFSDGKLTLSTEVGGFLENYISKIELSKLIREIDDVYLKFGAPTRVYGTDEEVITQIQKRAVLADLRLIPAPRNWLY
jgi:uncharacterized FAD-dependent dehydrogenase